ncbi:MAG: hypothetical protein J6D28_03980 [Bacilli bacterium]|nr:hypothetical protein [Bacilli bacterium]
MIEFNKIKYERIDFDKTKLNLEKLIQRLKNTDDFKEYLSIVEEINEIQSHIEEMCDYADIRNMRNLNDEYYRSEIEYWNLLKPKFDLLFLPFYNEIYNSKFKDLLLKKLPNNFLKLIEYQIKITSDKNIELLKRENDLKTQYRNLNKTKIIYDGEEKSIGTISSFFSNKDRNIRKKAHDAINDFYYEHRDEYTNIFYELINIRNKIAKNLGFNNYVQYSLYKRQRFGYDYTNISNFRNNIIEFIVPLCTKISEWQKEELGLAKLEYFDTIFFEKMPNLKMNGNDLLNAFKKLFAEVDKELSNLYNNMLDNNYIDFLQRDDKVNFSITNYLTETGLPAVTGNYKNSYLDVQTTTHEIGHSYQKYCASIKDKKYIVSPLLKYPPMEIAEMFSYSMELIMMDHVSNLFDEDDYKKYCFMKVYNMVFNLPYICLVDEFQQTIYSKENLNVQDIKSIWLELVNKYHLEKSNSGHINLNNGGYFYRQSHIYLDPFYYIDYALSYFGAFAIWNSCGNDIELFKEIGGVASYYSFSDLIDKYHMPNPFDKDTVKDIAIKLKNELNAKRLVRK